MPRRVPKPKTDLEKFAGRPALWKFLGPAPGIPFIPTPSQLVVFSEIKIPWAGEGYPQIYALNMGRQYGKTTLDEKFVWEGLLSPNDAFGPPVVRVTADTEEHGYKIWDKFLWHAENTPLKGLVKDYNRERKLLTLLNGANVQLLSANNPNTLSGDTVSLWVVDEAQFFSEEAWVNMLPSIAARKGVIILTGVCDDWQGPFYTACMRGDSSDFRRYRRFKLPTGANPFIPPEQIEFAQSILTDEKFRQLYLAEWTNETGTVFRGFENCLCDDEIKKDSGGWEFVNEPVSGVAYYAGVDLGRLRDWTVVSIWRRDGKLVAWDRFNEISWGLQKARIKTLCQAYNNALACVDSTGLGDPVLEDLIKLGVRAEGYQISSNVRKRLLIDELAIRISGVGLQIPRIKVLQDEIGHFQTKKTGPGTVIYEAATGYTDDFVLSCALAMQVVPKGRRMTEDLAISPRAEGLWEEFDAVMTSLGRSGR